MKYWNVHVKHQRIRQPFSNEIVFAESADAAIAMVIDDWAKENGVTVTSAVEHESLNNVVGRSVRTD